MIKLREYQEKAVEEIINDSVNKEFVIANPTGTGKSLMFVELMNRYEKLGYKSLYLTGYGVLIDDIKNRFGKPINVLKGTQNEINKDSLIWISTYQTMQNRLNNVDLKNCILLLDETKAYDGKMYNKIIEYIQPNIVIHSSATPYNQKGQLLYPKAKIVKTITIKEAEDKGYRVPLKTYVPSFTNGLNLEDVSKVGNEYNQEELEQIMTQDWFMKKFKKWINNLDLKNRSTLIITTNIKSTELTYEQIEGIDYLDIKENKDLFDVKEDHNIDSKVIKARVHSKMNDKDNKLILDAFGEGKIDIVVSASKLTTGYDNPRIDTIIALRPTLIRSLFMQFISRAIRPFKNKIYSDFFDLGNLTMNHGLYSWEDNFDYSKDISNIKKTLEKMKIEDLNEIYTEDGNREIDPKILYAYRANIENIKLQNAKISELYKVLISSRSLFKQYEAFWRLYSLIHGSIPQSTYDWIYEKLYDYNMRVSDPNYFKSIIKNRMINILFNKKQTNHIEWLFHNFHKYNMLHIFFLTGKTDNKILEKYKNKFQNSKEKNKIKFIEKEILYNLKNRNENDLKLLVLLYNSVNKKRIKNYKVPKFASLYYFLDWIFSQESYFDLYLKEPIKDDDLDDCPF
jgi:superfamily II DNA or RNA helicase